MPDVQDTSADSAEKAYASATAEVKPQAAPKAPEAKPAIAELEAKPEPKAKPAVAKKAEAKAKVKPKPKPKPVAAAKPKPLAKPKASVAPAKAKIARPKKIKTLTPTRNTQPKEPAKMAETLDFTAPISDAMAEMQTSAKAAYEKSTEMAGEVTEFTKGNVEALVETGKILSSGIQNVSKTLAEEAKSAFETASADMKEMAAIKSPTDLFQLQSKLMRRNFDSLVAMGSKASESMLKLGSEAAAPLSGRMSIAADIVSKAA